jgi:hypothetical protein
VKEKLLGGTKPVHPHPMTGSRRPVIDQVGNVLSVCVRIIADGDFVLHAFTVLAIGNEIKQVQNIAVRSSIPSNLDLLFG